MDFFERLEEARKRWNVLEHPFYSRWERGELTADELSSYAGQYRHAVVALAETAAQAGAHPEEEAAHVELWDEFARAAGSEPAEPRSETRACVESWTAGRDKLEALAILYAVESGQPDISRTKLEGLVGHYGYAAEGPATEYFRLHGELDVEHAAEARQLIEADASREDADRLVAAATGALEGNWKLLDGVEAAR